MTQAPAQVAKATTDPGEAERAELYARGDFRALRALPKQPASDSQRAAISIDPVHATVIAVCALGFVVIALRYVGALP